MKEYPPFIVSFDFYSKVLNLGYNAVAIDIETIPRELPSTVMEIRESSLKPPERYKDPQKIEEWLANQKEHLRDKDALDPDYCQIVAIAMFGMATCDVLYGESETEILTKFWRRLTTPNVVTFNGYNFDIPVILRRSLYLGIPTKPIDNRRYLSLDLMQILNGWQINRPYKSLKLYCALFDIEYDPPADSDQIETLYKAGEYDIIASKCMEDAKATWQLFWRIKDYIATSLLPNHAVVGG